MIGFDLVMLVHGGANLVEPEPSVLATADRDQHHVRSMVVASPPFDGSTVGRLAIA